MVLLSLAWWSSWLSGRGLQEQEVANEPELAHSITWENLDRVLADVANEQRELILTTFAGQSEDDTYERNFGMAAWNLNFLEHLRRVNATNVLVVGCSPHACDASVELGLPCWQDRLGWQVEKEFFRGRQVALKWFYLQQIVERNFHPVFLDNDVVVLQNPFDYWDHAYDFQGLYDANSGTDPVSVSDPDDPGDADCPLAKTGEYGYHWPCMSTGIMFVRATEHALAVITAMVHHLVQEPKHWEQQMFQNEVLRFVSTRFQDPTQEDLVGHPRGGTVGLGGTGAAGGSRAVLDRRRNKGFKFRLLPLEQYHNVNTYRARRRLGLPVDTVMIHCGYIHGFEKIVHLQALGLWLLTNDPELYQKV